MVYAGVRSIRPGKYSKLSRAPQTLKTPGDKPRGAFNFYLSADSHFYETIQPEIPSIRSLLCCITGEDIDWSNPPCLNGVRNIRGLSDSQTHVLLTMLQNQKGFTEMKLWLEENSKGVSDDTDAVFKLKEQLDLWGQRGFDMFYDCVSPAALTASQTSSESISSIIV